MGDAQLKAQLEAALARIAELEGDQDTLLDDMVRLNTCLSRAHESRESAQRRLKAARAEAIKLRGLVSPEQAE